jgi:hypothetical protein
MWSEDFWFFDEALPSQLFSFSEFQRFDWLFPFFTRMATEFMKMLSETRMPKTSSAAGSLEQRGIPQCQRQGKMNPIDLVLKPVHNAPRVQRFRNW